MHHFKAHVCAPPPGQLSEGPVWNPHTQELLWVDIRAGHIHRATLTGIPDHAPSNVGPGRTDRTPSTSGSRTDRTLASGSHRIDRGPVTGPFDLTDPTTLTHGTPDLLHRGTISLTPPVSAVLPCASGQLLAAVGDSVFRVDGGRDHDSRDGRDRHGAHADGVRGTARDGGGRSDTRDGNASGSDRDDRSGDRDGLDRGSTGSAPSRTRDGGGRGDTHGGRDRGSGGDRGGTGDGRGVGAVSGAGLLGCVARLPLPADGVRRRTNDAKVDPRGRLLVGTMSEDGVAGSAALYRVDPDGILTALRTGVTISNGLGWSPDGRTLYYADSPTRRVDAFDYNLDTGTLGTGRPFAHFDDGEPDGLTVDSEGQVWIAVWGAGQVRAFTSSGEPHATIDVGPSRVSSCTFAGPNLDVLVITTAAEGEAASEPNAGRLFACVPGVIGLPVTLFADEKVVITDVR